MRPGPGLYHRVYLSIHMYADLRGVLLSEGTEGYHRKDVYKKEFLHIDSMFFLPICSDSNIPAYPFPSDII